MLGLFSNPNIDKTCATTTPTVGDVRVSGLEAKTFSIGFFSTTFSGSTLTTLTQISQHQSGITIEGVRVDFPTLTSNHNPNLATPV